MSGEEVGAEGRAFAHIASGPEAGNSYELAWLGNMSYENVVANGHTGDKTVVAMMDDTSPLGQVYFYFGDKKAAGSAIEMAGLTGGTVFGLKIDELDPAGNNETNDTTLGVDAQSTFSLIDLGDVSADSGARERDWRQCCEGAICAAALDETRRTYSQRPDCVAGVVGLELRNVAANYPFERAQDLRGSSRILATETIRV
jgi:hypothetical protein